jgi:hypothetical protein
MADFPADIGHLPNEKEVEFRSDEEGGPHTKPPGRPGLTKVGDASDSGGGWWATEPVEGAGHASLSWNQVLTNPVVIMEALA